MATKKDIYDNNYIKENQRQFLFKVNRKNEPEMVEWLESKEHIQSYIKQLIRDDMNRSNTRSVPVPKSD